MIDFAVRPATLIGQTPPPSRNIAGAPAKSWRVTTSPKTRAGLAPVTEMEAPGGGSGAFASTHVENSVDEASLSNKRTPWLHGLTTRQHRDLVPRSKATRDHAITEAGWSMLRSCRWSRSSGRPSPSSWSLPAGVVAIIKVLSSVQIAYAGWRRRSMMPKTQAPRSSSGDDLDQSGTLYTRSGRGR